VSAKLGSKGAKALSRALSPGSAKKASAAAGGIKAGKRLGSVAVSAVPKTVEVLPGGTLEFEATPSFGLKLFTHCVSALTPGGVEPIPPGTEDPLTREFTFPVTGGSIAPDFSAGRVLSAGGQKLTKNLDGVQGGGAIDCTGPPDPGTTMTLTEWEPQFEIKALAALTVVPAGSIGIGGQGTFDLTAPAVPANPPNPPFPAATTSVDPNTKQVTITGAPVIMDPLAASVLNTVFPNATAAPSQDFMGGELLGHFSLHVTTH
jgi:hypothetical protein